MERMFSQLQEMPVEAIDGKIGAVWDLLFVDQGGQIRYVVVDTPAWLFGKHVLVAPKMCRIGDGVCTIDLRREQIKRSPDESTDPPVSLQEQERARIAYTLTPGLFGNVGSFPVFPGAMLAQQDVDDGETGDRPHLRSVAEVTTYRIAGAGTAESPGQCIDAVIDCSDWRVASLIVNFGPKSSEASQVDVSDIERIEYGTSSIFLRRRMEGLPESPGP